jgi:membrane-associated phospholipid phosphatase
MRPQPAHPLLDGRTSRRAAILLACCTVVLAVLGALVAHQPRVDGLDQAIDFWVVRSASGHQNLLFLIAALPTVIPAGGTSLIMVAACLMTGRLKGAVLAATAVPVASALCDALLKPLVHRDDLAYPSGHVTSITALASMLTILLALPPRPLGRGLTRLLVPAAAGLAACAVAVAVIGLRWHYFTDTIGGAALGTGTVCALALILDRPIVSRWLQAPASWLPSNSSNRRHADLTGHQTATDIHPDT